MSVLAVRRARTDEMDGVLELLTGVLPWLRQRDQNQWSTWPTWRTKLAAPIARGDTWLLTLGDTAIGTITLERQGDRAFWTEAELATPATYVSKLAVHRSYAGRHLGAGLLAWAGDRAHQQGQRWLRLDAWKANHRLHDYYTRYGFTHIRTCEDPNYQTGALFQIAALPMGTELSSKIQEHHRQGLSC